VLGAGGGEEPPPDLASAGAGQAGNGEVTTCVKRGGKAFPRQQIQQLDSSQMENLLVQMYTTSETISDFDLATVGIQCGIDFSVEEASVSDRQVLAALHLRHDKDNSLILHKVELDGAASPFASQGGTPMRNSEAPMRQSSLESLISGGSTGFRSEDFVRIDWIGLDDCVIDDADKSVTFIMLFRAAQLNISSDDLDVKGIHRI
jgi:hypothetical protein